MRPAAFELYHPIVPAVLIGGAVVLAMLAIEPVCTAILLVGALLFSALTQGVDAALSKLRWQLPLLLLICLINPVFSSLGSTLVAKVGPFLVYAESLAYGAVMGALLVSVLMWIEALGLVIGQDELLVMTGGALPSVTLAFSMTAQLVPQLMRRARMVIASLRAVSRAHGERAARTRVMGALATWALEDSLERADSMRARGWGATHKRSRFRSRTFRERDAVAVVLCATLVAAAALGVQTALSTWRFYPRMEGFAPSWAYLSLSLLSFAPSFVVVVEHLLWRREP